MSEHRLLVGGELVDAASGARYPNVNPATEEVIGEVADASVEDVARAVGAARVAFDETSWALDRGFRKRCLEQLRDALAGEREELRAELTAEIGCPPRTHGAQLDDPIEEAFRFPLRMIEEFDWERELFSDPQVGRRIVLKEPVGVVGAITPWNFPVEIILTKLVSALAAGCTVVLKAAPEAPFNATRIGRLVAERTDIPPGVVNVLTSSADEVGAALVDDPRVDTISFTGSTETGRRVMAGAAATVKRVFLELGGKSAHVVLDDADLEQVLPLSAMVCVHAGQGCALLTRLLVPRRRADECEPILERIFRSIPYGDPGEAANVMGPLISARQRDRVLDYVARGVDEGARLLLGGGRPAHLPRGYFVEPTVFVDVDNDMTIAREEIFGPVLCVIPYEDEDDAVRLANDSIYGLSAAVSSADDGRALAVARRIRAGSVGAGWSSYTSDTPFGGYKQSGLGRQNGLEGFEQYLETKAVSVGPVG